MKSKIIAGSRWRTLMVLTPLVLLVILAIAASGSISAGSAEYAYTIDHVSPSSSYGVGNEMLYVANGRGSDVAIIDVGTMSIVDSVPVPVQPTPGPIHDWNPALMNWEIHGAVPSQDRTHVYAVGALSAGSYDAAGSFRLADYRMYDVNVATKATEREIPLQGDGASINPVGFCGLEYNLNDESSNEIVAANMNASNGVLASVLSDPVTGDPIDLSGVRGSGTAVESGGWTYTDISGAGSYTGFLNLNQDLPNTESSVCGISWDASGTHGFASQQFQPLTDKVDWNPATGTGTAAGTIAPFTGASLQHQSASDKDRDRYYVTDSDGNIYVYAMSTGAEVATINIRALTNTPLNNVHGVEVSPTNSDVIYVTSRDTPVASGSETGGSDGNNSELAVDVSNLLAPQLIGSVSGLETGACGVYAIPDKQNYYTAANPTGVGNNMLFVANGRGSDVAVIDVGTMSIVDSIPVPNQPTPGPIHDWNPALMNWEIHGVVPSQDRTHVYAVGALSAGSYDAAGSFRLADYRMYDVNTATNVTEREIPLQGDGASINPVGFCGLEYNLNDESSNEIVAANMNASNGVLASVLSDPVTGDPIDLSGVRGSGTAVESGGWNYTDISGAGSYTGFLNLNQDLPNTESSVCGISWDASGTHGFASQQFQPLTDKVDWNPATGTGTAAGTIAPFAGASLQHQSASDKARDRMYVTDSDGNIYVYAMSTGAEVATINIRALTGTTENNIHGVEVSPTDPDVLFVTSRDTPNGSGSPSGGSDGNNMELVVDVSSLSAPKLLGSVSGLQTGVCGVYAIGDKSEYYGSKPALSLSKTSVYWGSYADYTAHLLSVDFSISNSANDAANVAVTGSSSNNGVTIATSLPASVGSIAAGSSAPVTLQYNVDGAASFVTTTHASAQNGSQIFSY